MSNRKQNAVDDLKLMLCDACCYKIETDPSLPIADMCDRCKKKLLDMLFGAAEEHQRILDEWDS